MTPPENSPLIHLLDANRAWVGSVNADDPTFFEKLARQQAPEYLWIGCSDSRVPANQITGLAPGEVFVHRNIANVVVPSDLNALSVLQFAVELLKVRHVIVVGHYGCSGVGAALDGLRIGLADNWLGHVRDVHAKHHDQLSALPDRDARYDRLCELNVIEQVTHVCATTVVQDAWIRRQPLSVHGWVYGIRDGLVRDLGISVASNETLPAAYERCVNHVSAV
ncbi:carbonate dehydratase [Pandoraea sp.]|uniref:carbonate dehydratase n=1 Tax=Pandoraea sp. TaxID=1883445 RepID=UPI001218A9E1|nr:carbonate dehydratase [Pandoraea sp.]MBU6492431.1 carbonate dehydratase [Burkholderiales bacterium]MDE2288679.1 carbonate dehydratase [Burkholderiales bacterium]MDE2608999.1 carbonate dehydratase [Burkholderiales bacterium]TAL52124.1 MAG: carbonate dehydratase [Pandoraea sp.]TAM16015.1 MAG: carbonate dehydratase [Pandoraea sp.]